MSRRWRRCRSSIGEGEFLDHRRSLRLRQVDPAEEFSPGLIRIPSGHLSFRGKPIAGPQRDMGIVFQSPVLFPWRTVLDNVLLPVDVLKLPTAPAASSARSELLEIVGLVGFCHANIRNELSGGMQQRVVDRAGRWCTIRPSC